jgi:hypothetical protein
VEHRRKKLLGLSMLLANEFSNEGRRCMRSKLIVALGFSALLVLVGAQNAVSSLVVTTANDTVQLTNQTPVTYTGTSIGLNTISSTLGTAIGSLTITRSSSSLDYLWSATPDFSHTKGVGITAVDAFTLSGPANFQLTFTGSYLDGYLWNTSTNTYVERFGFDPGKTGIANVGPTPSFSIPVSLSAGNYELRFNTGALPTGSPVSGEVQLSAVPIPSALWLLGSGLIGFIGIRRRFKN